MLVRAQLLDSAWEAQVAIYPGPLEDVALHRWVIREHLGTMGFRNSNNEATPAYRAIANSNSCLSYY